MRRREFIGLFSGGLAASALGPSTAHAQLGQVPRIGVLMGYAETDPSAQAQVEALRQGLQKLGWHEGDNILIEVRFPTTDAGRVRASLAVKGKGLCLIAPLS